MAIEEKGSGGFEEFKTEYDSVEIPKGKHINRSNYTLEQQAERFNKFSHTKDECKDVLKEAHDL